MKTGALKKFAYEIVASVIGACGLGGMIVSIVCRSGALLEEDPYAFLASVASAFLLGFFLGMSLRFPGRFRARKEAKRSAIEEENLLRKAHRNDFEAMSADEKWLIKKLATSGRYISNGSTRTEWILSLPTACGYVSVSEIDKWKCRLSLNEEGAALVEHCKDLLAETASE